MADHGQVLLVASPDQAVDPEVQSKRERVGKLLAIARKQYQMTMAAESRLREKQFDDLRFVASEQWATQDIADRQTDGRPCLTINRLPQFVNQVTNAARQSRPAIQVIPIDGGSDVETAEVFQGVIRHIENQSDAQTAYGTAAEAQARIGRGYWRVTTEFDDGDSFSQIIRIKRVRNPFAIVMDPSGQELDGSDARFCFVIEDMPKDAYIAKYGEASFASLTEFNLGPERSTDWMPEGKVRIAEWWRVIVSTESLFLVLWPDGRQSVVRESILKQWPEADQQAVKILRERPVETREVRCAVINAVEILEGNEDKSDGAKWPGQWIPIVPVIGQEIDLNGEIDYRGMVRDAKDPQRLYNYQNTALAEALALAPKAPYIGFTGQFEGHEEKWRQANRRNFPYLEVNRIGVGNDLEQLPQRQTADTQVSAIVQAIAQADNDLKATTGLYDPSLGVHGPAQSGKAITALQKQGEMANSNFLDNEARAIRFTGKILVDLIPRIYDTPRILRILGTDGKPKAVMVHANQPASHLPEILPQGVKRIYDLGVGKYDITIDVGPSQDSRRQEAQAGLTAIVQAVPAYAQILGDLIVENMDWPGSQVAAARLRKMLPQQFQEGEDGQAPGAQAGQQLQQVQQQAQQMQQVIQQLQDQLSQATRMLQTKEMELSAQAAMKREEIASRERIARMQAELQILLAQAKAQQTMAEQRFDHAAAQVDAHTDHLQQLEQADLAHQQTLVQAMQPPPTAPGPSGPQAPGGAGPSGPTPSGPPPGAPPSGPPGGGPPA